MNDAATHDETVLRAQAGDMQAFEDLYRAHVARVYGLCLRMTANVATAEELTQQTFLHAWQKMRQFRGGSAFSTWLHRITVNVVLVHLRTQERRKRRVIATDDLAACEQPDSNATGQPGDRADLEEAITQLPAQARTVFVLHDIEGWQHDEIAAELGVTVGTTKAQLHRARKLLQEALQ